jgi:Glycosyltransferase sugar-binding region containing DXD motif
LHSSQACVSVSCFGDCNLSTLPRCFLQRADAMRLFFLHKYGGIYIDLDIECLRSLDFLRHYGWVMPQVPQDQHQAACVWLSTARARTVTLLFEARSVNTEPLLTR